MDETRAILTGRGLTPPGNQVESLLDTGARGPSAHTWADGFGVWHVRVSTSAAWPLGIARRALRDELQARDAQVARGVWMRPARVPEMDAEGTMVYREGDDETGMVWDVLTLKMMPREEWEARKPAGHTPDYVTCGECGRTWDDAHATHLTPAPSARCPFEYEH
jgi:hypothetical protein